MHVHVRMHTNIKRSVVLLKSQSVFLQPHVHPQFSPEPMTLTLLSASRYFIITVFKQAVELDFPICSSKIEMLHVYFLTIICFRLKVFNVQVIVILPPRVKCIRRTKSILAFALISDSNSLKKIHSLQLRSKHSSVF